LTHSTNGSKNNLILKTTYELKQELESFHKLYSELKSELQKVIVGYDDLLTDTLVALFAHGHVLLEGVPGLGKTHLVRSLGTVLGLGSGRVQCTPDLMPADILGTQIFDFEAASGSRTLRFEPGPVFHSVVLVDEINRATPKTQSALLEVMQEHHVTSGGISHPLPQPFFVLATQNPMEMEGTYPLPEAQLDRFFFKLHVPFPSLTDLVAIAERTAQPAEPLRAITSAEAMIAAQKSLSHILITPPLTTWAARLILSTHPDQAETTASVQRYLAYGASPRGLQSLTRAARVYAAIDGRVAVSVADIKRAALPALRHRLIRNFEGEAANFDIDQLIRDLIDHLPAPDVD
jgi:MoxR-like ATPase